MTLDLQSHDAYAVPFRIWYHDLEDQIHRQTLSITGSGMLRLHDTNDAGTVETTLSRSGPADLLLASPGRLKLDYLRCTPLNAERVYGSQAGDIAYFTSTGAGTLQGGGQGAGLYVCTVAGAPGAATWAKLH